ncbi:MAG: hypothetical protein SWQ30_05690 [Thermodesulfobacteriota bacterium]|nr:hypothetical protein [Thermodesulfobacteriota bacterium]
MSRLWTGSLENKKAYLALTSLKGGEGRGDPNNLPENWLSQIHAIAPEQPVLIAETGYMAERLKVPEYRMDVAGTPEWQKVYMGKLLATRDV